VTARREIGDVGVLAESMKTFGVLEPIVLVPGLDEEGGVVLIAGHRRRAAARKAGLATVPAEIRSDLDSEEHGRQRALTERSYQRVALQALRCCPHPPGA
jgi:ParB family transcriptional regulator, chromosome partitioning protein